MALPPLSTLLALFPDNTSGLIEPADVRQQTTELYQGIDDNINEFANYLPLVGGTLSGFLFLNADPTLPNHAATKAYVDQIAIGTQFVLRSGDSMTGDLLLPSDPTTGNSATPKSYVDTSIANNISAFSSNVILTDGSNPMDDGYTPSNAGDVATKSYVESQIPSQDSAVIKAPSGSQVITGNQLLQNEGITRLEGVVGVGLPTDANIQLGVLGQSGQSQAARIDQGDASDGALEVRPKAGNFGIRFLTQADPTGTALISRPFSTSGSDDGFRMHQNGSIWTRYVQIGSTPRLSDETGSANLYITPTGADDQYGIRVESTATNANYRGLFSRLQVGAASTARCLELRVNQSTQWMIQGRNDGNELKFSVDGEGNTVTNDLNVQGDLTVNGAGIAPIASGTVGLAGGGIEVTQGWTVNQGLANLYTVIAPANSGYWELVATANMLGATNDNKARTVTVKRSGDGSFQIRTYQDNTGTESAFSFIAVRATPP